MADPAYRTPEYRAALRYWERAMRTNSHTCRRCGLPIPAGDRAAWDLGHSTPAAHGGNEAFEPEHRYWRSLARPRSANAHRWHRPVNHGGGENG